MGFVFVAVERLLGADLIAPLRLLARDSLRLFFRRLGRIRRTASALLNADLVPPLPLRLQVETIDICNLKCRMCTREALDGMNTSPAAAAADGALRTVWMRRADRSGEPRA